LQAIVGNENATSEQISEALMFNRKLWSIFLSDVLRDENQQPLQVRQNIANIVSSF
jgi:flagellar protein FlaF